ncbi:MAG: DUF2934 domain-containing protein [Acidobacteriota bacterium]
MSSPARILEPETASLEEQIQRRAYEIYAQRGPQAGSELEDWLLAERQIREESGLHAGGATALLSAEVLSSK